MTEGREGMIGPMAIVGTRDNAWNYENIEQRAYVMGQPKNNILTFTIAHCHSEGEGTETCFGLRLNNIHLVPEILQSLELPQHDTPSIKTMFIQFATKHLLKRKDIYRQPLRAVPFCNHRLPSW